MTERERIEKTYQKVKEKYPHITEKVEIDKLAIKSDKQNLLLKAFGLFLGAVLCCIINLLLTKAKTSFSESNALVFIAMLSALFEMVRTLIKFFKVEKTYKPVVTEGYKQTVDVATIMKNYSSFMHNLSEFYIVREKLYDKEDELDVLINNATSHDYYLYFKNSQTDEPYTLKVKKDDFDDAVLGAEYFLILTKCKNESDSMAIAAYATTRYNLAEDVKPFCHFNIA